MRDETACFLEDYYFLSNPIRHSNELEPVKSDVRVCR